MSAKRGLTRQIERERLELESLSKQEKALRSQLKGLDDSDQAILGAHDAFVVESEIIDSWRRNVGHVRETLAAAVEGLSSLPTHPEIDDSLPNSADLKSLDEAMGKFIQEIKERISNLTKDVNQGSPLLAPIEAHLSKWQVSFETHEAKYEAAKQKASSQRQVLTQIQEVERRAKTVRTSLNNKKAALAKHGDPELQYSQARSQWSTLYRNRGELLANKCEELTDLSGGRIRAQIKRGGGLERAQRELERLVTGTRIRSKKLEELCSTISNSADPAAEWAVILAELEALALLPKEQGGDSSLPETPALRKAGLTQADLEKLAAKVTVDDWLDLSLVELDDVPIFDYEQREGEYIPFAAASAGQQATALLRVLLNQEGPPLVIDQPEEDLDNQVVLEIVKDMWRAKQRRQMIFSSHNANIVVNGDADLVACCDYRRAGDQSGGHIKCEGAIDIEEIRQEITAVMEGGKAAFRLRKEKYGF